MTLAHTVIAQVSLGVLLHIDEKINKDDGPKKFPLAEYAAKNWTGHARFEGVSPKIQDGMKRFFDPSNRHLSVWIWIWESEFTDSSSTFNFPSRFEILLSSLTYAAGDGLHDIAEWLIVEHSQNVDHAGCEDYSPLGAASRGGHSEAVRVLLEHGADPEIQDEEGMTPLKWASRDGYVDVVSLLLKYDAEIEDYPYYSALHFASIWERVAVVRVLLENGADVNARGDYGHTPLHLADNDDVARVLLECGADPGARDNTGQTPLLRTTSVKAAQALLENGADPNARDNSNGTPLHARTGRLNTEVAQVLLENGADPNARDDENRTPLHWASEMGDLDFVRLLLRHSADIHARDDEGLTPFQAASASVDGEYRAVRRLLLEHGAEDHI